VKSRRGGGVYRAKLWAAIPTRMLQWLAFLVTLIVATPALSHPAPFSYLDIDLRSGEIDGALTMHVIDAAHDLGLSQPDQLFDPNVLALRWREIAGRLDQRMTLSAGQPLKLEWTQAQALPGAGQLKLFFRIPNERPGALTVRTDLFPYDPYHQTFVNLYEGGRLRQQWIFSHGAAERTYYFGTTAGALEVMRTFIPAGVHHILIGPDHLLFLFGLLLIGGSWKTLAKIVTAFTLAHSLTLSLATLGIFSPPPSIIEPAIALSIVVVGVDNLMRDQGRDLRPLAAGVFGLVHGFGFANVLREFGLPREALAWSLFSFNVGVEIGQLIVVAIVASLLNFVRRWNPSMGRRVTVTGSIVVIAAGVFWFVQRVFFPGGN
jgi:hydrogenase/urease accessory protein HupE